MPYHDRLKIDGWVIATMHGPYCVAFRQGWEAVFEWKWGEWHLLSRRVSG